jgi:hypothetical protein
VFQVKNKRQETFMQSTDICRGANFARILVPFAFVAAMAGPAMAGPICSTPAVKSEPAIGLGFSVAFGSGKVEPSVGIRLLSGNVKGRGAATVGLDYSLSTKRVRPTVGAAFIGTNSYFGIDMGFSLDGSGFDFGVGAGGLKTAMAGTAICPT